MKWLIIVAVLFSLGAMVGNKTASVEPEVITVHKTKVVTEPAPDPIIVTEMPQICLDALVTAEAIDEAAIELDSYSTRQLDLISEARAGMAQGDIDVLNNAEEQQRILQGKTVDAVIVLGELRNTFKDQQDECEAASD